MKTTNNYPQWYETLPDGCPPMDAADCNGTFFRIANASPAETADFFSQRMLQPAKIFADVDECVARSLSVFDTKEAAEQRLKLPKFKKAHIAKIELVPADGKIKKTFGPQHYSWWRSVGFDVTKAIIL